MHVLFLIFIAYFLKISGNQEGTCLSSNRLNAGPPGPTQCSTMSPSSTKWSNHSASPASSVLGNVTLVFLWDSSPLLCGRRRPCSTTSAARESVPFALEHGIRRPLRLKPLPLLYRPATNSRTMDCVALKGITPVVKKGLLST